MTISLVSTYVVTGVIHICPVTNMKCWVTSWESKNLTQKVKNSYPFLNPRWAGDEQSASSLEAHCVQPFCSILASLVLPESLQTRAAITQRPHPSLLQQLRKVRQQRRLDPAAAVGEAIHTFRSSIGKTSCPWCVPLCVRFSSKTVSSWKVKRCSFHNFITRHQLIVAGFHMLCN